MQQGCPCDAAEPVACYEGPDGTENVGACRGGTRACASGEWAACVGQVVPSEESCNGADESCDGVVDDGVANACGNCDAECRELVWGGADWNPADEGEGNLRVEDGALTLRPLADLSTLWIPRGDGSLSKLDTETGVEAGRYRVAVGDSYIVRSIGTNLESDLATLSILSLDNGTVVARVNASDCPAGETSGGPADVLEFGDDACVVWAIDIGYDGSGGGIAWELRGGLDGAEYFLWAVHSWSQKVMEISEDGEPTGREVRFTNIYPGPATVDGDGDLWVASAGGNDKWLYEIDTATAEIVREATIPVYIQDCLTVDAENNVWMTGRTNEKTGAFDQDTDELVLVDVASPGGVAAGADGYVWIGGSDRQIHRVEVDTWSLDSYSVGLGVGYGIVYPAVDGNGEVWAVGPETASTFPAEDPASFDVEAYDLGYAGACGDMTGTQLRNLLDETGVYRHVFEGCAEGSPTRWVSLRYDADTPGDSRIDFTVRSAADREILEVTDDRSIGSAPTDASPLGIEGVVEGAHLLEVEMTLHPGSGGELPQLREIGALLSCPLG